MDSKEIILSFFSRKTASNDILWSTGDRLCSSGVCLAQWSGGMVIVNKTFYYDWNLWKIQNSITSRSGDTPVMIVDGVPKGASDLSIFTKSRKYE